MGEFSNIHYMGDYELRFIQDPYGLADLEYNIVENYHRHNSGYALKRFKKNIEFLAGNRLLKRYEGFFHGKFKEISYDYIEKLTAFKFKGYWHQDVIDKGIWFWWLERSFDNILNRIIVPILRGKKNIEPISIHLLKNEVTYVPIADKERFYQLTREYIDKLFYAANSENKEFVMVDQLLPPSNSSKYLRYFNWVRIISVDRDPRDLYLLEKFVWKGGVMPVSNVKDFCEWYKITRAHKAEEVEDSRVMRIYFEDLIYHYEETVNKICLFLGIDKSKHIEPQTKLIPSHSIKNTQIWTRYPHAAEDIKIIENILCEHCYNQYD